MAAVLKPKDPSQFKAGMPITVHWKGTDKLGRAAEQNKTLSLEIHVH